MSGPTPEPEYFKNNDYINLKKRFGKRKSINYDDTFTNDFIKSKNQEIINLQFPEKIIRYLREYLVSGHVHYSYDKRYVCRYINFWLNREIRPYNKFKDESNFDLFKNFALGFSKAYYGNEDGACKGILNYIGPDTYERMDTIYKLYELYDELTSTEIRAKNPCETFGNIIANYIKAIKKYDNEEGKDYILIKKLLDLRDLTVKSDIPSYVTCPHRITEFIEPNEYKERLRKDEIKKSQEEELKRRKQEEEEEEEREVLERQKSQISQQREKLDIDEPLRNEEDLSLEVPTQKNERGQSFGVESPRGEGYKIMQEYARPSSFYSERLRTQKEQLEQTERGYGGFKDETIDTSTTSGITGSITDTISGFIKEVDPAPVLGVSGIQSFEIIIICLYYFKKKLSLSYNYVLNFLNFLFNFSIPQLDPSLEEEEDDSVKFLAVSEDFHQISQIFRNMVAGMLDIVQWI
ncbi:hypothetical protein PVMG_05813 [Plasmodium vivax Mauritania I]|uniref:Uncharacterized protein n=1 Tax=Plasmodium vivax Mauritania I TaxID=1035515 RepID=A0A0J9TK80_PLAVI|nr:hypothetical protein PVMG_05813 [Plasmodium vivax Mauritania I]